jgi:RNA polymerase sigma-70 factor (ECF subfamily)
MDYGTIAEPFDNSYASIPWSAIAGIHITVLSALYNRPQDHRAGVPLSQAVTTLKDLRDLDPQVLSELHKAHFTELYRYARYRVSDDNLAEDIASETFLRLLDAVHSHKGPNSSIRGWLFGTAANLINDHFRRAYREDELLAEAKVNHSPTKARDALKQVEYKSLLSTAIEQLTNAQQHVIALRFGSGMSIQDTARIMNKNENAVKALQFRAIRSLRKELEVDA